LGFAYDVAAINPTRPEIPSVIITVTQVWFSIDVLFILQNNKLQFYPRRVL
jgi:hypothetical protein